jgi:hypothetical protein
MQASECVADDQWRPCDDLEVSFVTSACILVVRVADIYGCMCMAFM